MYYGSAAYGMTDAERQSQLTISNIIYEPAAISALPPEVGALLSLLPFIPGRDTAKAPADHFL
jgi:hypothetical protein